MRRSIPLFLLIVCCCAGPLLAEEPAYEMTTYQLVLLHRGPERSPIGERGIQRLQEERLAWLDRLNGEGKLLIEGPLDGVGELRGALVLDAGSIEAAQELVAADPWVAAGRTRPEIFTWWAAKGILQKAERLDRTSRASLGLLKRPAGAPDHYSEEKLQEIQAGHLENMSRMADAGDLVIAGPMGEDGVLRGILVFRHADSARIVELVQEGPRLGRGTARARGSTRGTFPPA